MVEDKTVVSLLQILSPFPIRARYVVSVTCPDCGGDVRAEVPVRTAVNL